MTTLLHSISVDSNPTDDEGLASVYFEYDSFKYLTLSYSPHEDESIYFEKDDQIKGINSNDVEYELHRNYLTLSVGDEIARKLETENDISIEFQINDVDYARLSESLQRIFSAKPGGT